MSAQLGHDCPRGLVHGISHVLVTISETDQQVWEELDDVRLKHFAQDGAQTLDSQESTFSVPEVLLVFQSLQEFGDDLQTFQNWNAKTLYQTS